MRITIEAIGEEWKPEYWIRLSVDFERDLLLLLDKWRKFLHQKALERAPVGETKRLAKSIYSHLDAIALEIILGSDLFYAWFQEMGTGVYALEGSKQKIYPKRAAALKIPLGRFQNFRSAPVQTKGYEVAPGKVRAGTAFTFRKYILGNRPQQFLMPLLDRYEDEIQRDLLRLAEQYGFY